MVQFSKYQGAGNDFVIIDNRTHVIDDSVKEKLAIDLCNRKFGIGSDGLILIENSDNADFKMDFLNPDGTRSFCGNGSRCAVRFCQDNEVITTHQLSFEAIDGLHKAQFIDANVKIEMKNVDAVETNEESYFIHTGSPHYIQYFNNVEALNMIDFGRSIRYSDQYRTEGTNVNVVEELTPSHIKVRTYERGVEDETLACGTGVTACAISYALKHQIQSGLIKIDAVGGQLSVALTQTNGHFKNIWLQGPAEFVFKGEIDV